MFFRPAITIILYYYLFFGFFEFAGTLDGLSRPVGVVSILPREIVPVFPSIRL